tara:strand:+ start:4581 stop:4853 length:273 start_codon:yes stop_codon:yes gene_type:complete
LSSPETEERFPESKTPFIPSHLKHNLLALAQNNVKRDVILEVINDKYRHVEEAKAKKPTSHSNADNQQEFLENVFQHTQNVLVAVFWGVS